MNRDRDSQKQRVYDADNNLGYHPSVQQGMSLDECRALIAKAMNAYGIKPETVRLADGRRNRHAHGGAWHIVLPRWARKTTVVLHECAHTITLRLHSGEPAFHGPEFMRVYVELLKRFTKIPHPEIARAFRAKRVRIARKAHAPKIRPARAVKKIEALQARLREIEDERFEIVRQINSLVA